MYVVCFCRLRDSETEADRACRLQAQVKSGVEHLSEKLQHLKTVRISSFSIGVLYANHITAYLQPHTHVLRPRLDPSSEEYILEQLAECEQKLVALVEELSSRDLDTIQKEMEDEEVRQNPWVYECQTLSSGTENLCSSATRLKLVFPVMLTEHSLWKALKQDCTVCTLVFFKY